MAEDFVLLFTHGAPANWETSEKLSFGLRHSFSMVQMYDWKNGKSSPLDGNCLVGNSPANLQRHFN